MKEVSDDLLWEQIKNGEHALIRVIDNPTYKFQGFIFDDGGDELCTTDKSFTVSDDGLRGYTSISEMMNCHKTAGKMILIFPPTEYSPYWIETVDVYNPNDFNLVGAKMVNFLRIAIVSLTSDERDYEIEMCRRRMLHTDKIKIGNNDRRLLLLR